MLFAVPSLAGADLKPTLLRTMTFMIVASPCAVVLATMPPLLSAIANAGRHGILVKSAVVMDASAPSPGPPSDKTGTTTEGRPRLATIRPPPGAGLGEHQLLAFAASAENPSEHPLAIADAARDAHLTLHPAQHFSSTPGRGITATVNGRTVKIGSPHRILDARTRDVSRAMRDLQQAGETPFRCRPHRRHRRRGPGRRRPARTARHRRPLPANSPGGGAHLVIAATFITVLAVWDLLGRLPLPLGVAGHEGSTVIVGLNGLRLLSGRAWRRAAASGYS